MLAAVDCISDVMREVAVATCGKQPSSQRLGKEEGLGHIRQEQTNTWAAAASIELETPATAAATALLPLANVAEVRCTDAAMAIVSPTAARDDRSRAAPKAWTKPVS